MVRKEFESPRGIVAEVLALQRTQMQHEVPQFKAQMTVESCSVALVY